MRTLRFLILALAAFLLSGCLSVPTSGDVHGTGDEFASSPDPGFSYVPRPPRAGAGPDEIVSGFLDAMEATSSSPDVARRYLTSRFAGSWNPSRRTIIYGDLRRTTGGRHPGVRLLDASWLDPRGAWRGALSDDRLHLRLVREAGEWRIASAPDALIVPRTWFERRFVRRTIYYTDPSGRVLVPEPVFVPAGPQTDTALVRSLVSGPGERLRRTVRSFLPTSAGEGLSVSVSGGLARVELSGRVPAARGHDAELMAAQVARTLHQDPAVKRVRLTVGGRRILTGTSSSFGVGTGAEVDPTGLSATQDLIALRNGNVMTRSTAGSFTPAGGAWSTHHDIRSVAMDIAGTRVAAVSGAGTRISLGNLSHGRVHATALRGQDLLPPAWDVVGRVWAVDRAGGHARVSYLHHGRVTSVDVPGISGRNVRAFLVSRDGTRLVALVRTPHADRVVATRLSSTRSGRVTGGLESRVLESGTGSGRLRDIAWRSPTEVIAAQQRTDTAVLHVMQVDGAGLGFSPGATTVGSDIDQLVGSPIPGLRVYARSGRTLIDLTGSGQDISLQPGTTQVGYAG